jgi:hypothetical protein
MWRMLSIIWLDNSLYCMNKTCQIWIHFIANPITHKRADIERGVELTNECIVLSWVIYKSVLLPWSRFTHQADCKPRYKFDFQHSTRWQMWIFRHVRSFVTSVCLSVCPSVRLKQVGCHCMNFCYDWGLRIAQKSVEKLQFWLKSDRTNGTLHADTRTLMIVSRWILHKMTNFSNKFIQKA